MKKIIIIGTIFLSFMITSLQAQVTIGTDEAPVEGSSLQFKDMNGVTDGGANATRGVVFPRVELTERNELYPMYSSNDPNYVANNITIKQLHVGMMVYNVTENVLFNKGIYVWTGTQWGKVAGSNAINGLYVDNSFIKLGGGLIENTTITMNGYDFNINTGANNKFNINGGLQTDSLFLDYAESTGGNARVILWSPTTKKIGLEPVNATDVKMAFLQSTADNQVLQSGIVATAQTYPVTWAISDPGNSMGGDMVTNNLLDYNSSDNSFSLREDANVEISGYVGFIGTAQGDTGSSAGTGLSIIVNASLQVNTSGTWQDFSSVRGVYYEYMAAYRQTLNIPPTMFQGKAGDKIRMVVIVKPSNLGTNHSNPRIVVPFGTKFSKSLKVIAQ